MKVCGAPCSAEGFIVITKPIPALEKSTCRKEVIVAAISRPSTFTTNSSPSFSPISSASSAAKDTCAGPV